MTTETIPNEKSTHNHQPHYTHEDAMKVVDDIFTLSKDNKYHPGAFIHGLIFALEATQQTYNIPPKQIAEVKRSARKYLQQIEETLQQAKKEEITTQ